eukprot:1157298-Pelagomonas_calceolata.AAC.29
MRPYRNRQPSEVHPGVNALLTTEAVSSMMSHHHISGHPRANSPARTRLAAQHQRFHPVAQPCG